jgi:hypothetical protein
VTADAHAATPAGNDSAGEFRQFFDESAFSVFATQESAGRRVLQRFPGNATQALFRGIQPR